MMSNAFFSVTSSVEKKTSSCVKGTSISGSKPRPYLFPLYLHKVLKRLHILAPVETMGEAVISTVTALPARSSLRCIHA